MSNEKECLNPQCSAHGERVKMRSIIRKMFTPGLRPEQTALTEGERELVKEIVNR